MLKYSDPYAVKGSSVLRWLFLDRAVKEDRGLLANSLRVSGGKYRTSQVTAHARASPLHGMNLQLCSWHLRRPRCLGPASAANFTSGRCVPHTVTSIRQSPLVAQNSNPVPASPKRRGHLPARVKWRHRHSERNSRGACDVLLCPLGVGLFGLLSGQLSACRKPRLGTLTGDAGPGEAPSRALL